MPPEGARWLVDGMNVIGSRPDGWWRDRRGAMRDLIARVARLSGETARPVTVVLDARPFEVAVPGSVEVVFAGDEPGAADDAIVRRVEAHPEPASLTVVTSDRALAERVAARGAGVVSSGAFRDRLAEETVGARPAAGIPGAARVTPK